MKKLLSFIAIAFSLGTTQATSAAAVDFSATVDATTVSVLMSGSGFTADVLGAPLDFTWDPAIMTFSSVSFANGWDDPSNPFGFSFTGNASSGTLTEFAAGNTSATPITGNFDIATLVFDIVSLGTTQFNFDSPFGNPFTDAAFAPITGITMNTGNIVVSAVPVPPALLLFGSSLLGLIGVNRNRKVA